MQIYPLADALLTTVTQPRALPQDQLREITEAAQEFESLFLSEMLKPMFEGLDAEPPFGGGKGEEIFRDMLLQEYGKKIAQTGTIGIADRVKQEMIRIQEETQNAARIAHG